MNLNGTELTTIVNAFAVFLSERLSDDMLPLAAAIYTQIGDTLATIAVVREKENKREYETFYGDSKKA